MQFSTLVTIASLTFATAVLGTGNHHSSSITACQTITTSFDYQNAFSTCTVLACLEVKPVTQKCGCTTIPTTTVPQTACPTSCGSTSYITAIEDCFPTSPPPSHTSSTHSTTTPISTTSSPSTTTTSSSSSSSSSSPSSTPSSTTPSLTSSGYSNTTKTTTKTETHITTLTTCPPSVTCTGQTTTYTHTEVCPTGTCTCVLPSVTYTTTVLPVPTRSVTTTVGNTPPSPTGSPSPTFIESNLAATKWGVESLLGAMAAFFVAALGLL